MVLHIVRVYRIQLVFEVICFFCVLLVGIYYVNQFYVSELVYDHKSKGSTSLGVSWGGD